MDTDIHRWKSPLQKLRGEGIKHVNLHLLSIFGTCRNWPLNTGDCLIWVAFKTGLTVEALPGWGVPVPLFH